MWDDWGQVSRGNPATVGWHETKVCQLKLKKATKAGLFTINGGDDDNPVSRNGNPSTISATSSGGADGGAAGGLPTGNQWTRETHRDRPHRDPR